ncbi:class I SAM-dependent methyltransferase [bacterium]|jgi:2-polyprenyl-3-methyl-5-hydroxy-6-metoxy-1,4-benzoquinol methylase|nr:class I SAM-dependent methyltransferase [Rhodobacterales bacterium]MDB3917134.1 class I SAM-dependent methyltransferase [bacterium]
MFLNTKFRTDKDEEMDDFSMKGEILRDALDKIAKINQLLGGNSLTLCGVQKFIRNISKNEIITILDVGCGNGEILRKLADYGNKNNLNFHLIGIDANNFTINHAKQLSENYSNISFLCLDIFEEPFRELKYDIVLCTLTLHHFKDNQIINLLNVFYTNSKIGIVINDLHRNAIAYRLFQVICFVFKLNKMSRDDGLISILRGFKKKELINYSNELKFKNYNIQWKWAFRYEWIISKI